MAKFVVSLCSICLIPSFKIILLIVFLIFVALLCSGRVQCGWIVSTGRLIRTLSGSFLNLLLYYRMRSSPISFNFRGRDLTKANLTLLVLTITQLFHVPTLSIILEKRSKKGIALSFENSTMRSLRKQPTFCGAVTGFPVK